MTHFTEKELKALNRTLSKLIKLADCAQENFTGRVLTQELKKFKKHLKEYDERMYEWYKEQTKELIEDVETLNDFSATETDALIGGGGCYGEIIKNKIKKWQQYHLNKLK